MNWGRRDSIFAGSTFSGWWWCSTFSWWWWCSTFSWWWRKSWARCCSPFQSCLYGLFPLTGYRGGICQCRQCRRQCKIFASGVNFSIFTHFFVFLSLKLLKLGEIDGVKFLAWKSGGVKFLTNSMSDPKLGAQKGFFCWSTFSSFEFIITILTMVT